MPSIATGVVESAPPFASPAPQLKIELTQLQRARTLIAEGKYSEALATLRQHEIDFRHSEHAATRSRYISLAQEGLRRAGASSSAP